MDEFLLSLGGDTALASWGVITLIVVPLAAAGIAAWVVIAQIRQLDRHRVADRKGEAIGILTSYVAEMSSIVVEAVSNPNSDLTQDDRFRLNVSYVKALALLEGDDQDVARWVNMKTQALYKSGKEIRSQSADEAESSKCVRTRTWDGAASIMQSMLDWQRGTLQTTWFSSHLR